MKRNDYSLVWSLIWSGLTTWFLVWLNSRYGFTGKWFFPSVMELVHTSGFTAWKVLFVILVPVFYFSRLYKILNSILFPTAMVVFWTVIVCIVLALGAGFGALFIIWLCN